MSKGTDFVAGFALQNLPREVEDVRRCDQRHLPLVADCLNLSCCGRRISCCQK